MVDRLKTAALASLLHDVGKVNYRAGKEKKSHSLLGSDFLRPFCEGSEAGGPSCVVSAIIMEGI